LASTILITGASRGLGFEFARQYAAEGWRVFVACRNPAAATKFQHLAQDTECILKVIAMVVTDAKSVREAAVQLKDVAIGLLINSAGIAGPWGQKTGNVDYASWAYVFAVNLMGPLRAIESFSDHTARSERRLVVTITSGMGSLADNTLGGSIAYCSSKAAVNMVMRSAAIDLAPRGITCVLLNPGWVRTDMGAPRRRCHPRRAYLLCGGSSRPSAQINRPNSITMTVANIRGEPSAAQSEAADVFYRTLEPRPACRWLPGEPQ
jgi:NAD(P)-dependent dehydrogenase (short-subunit alcohol dehydrogenase family)